MNIRIIAVLLAISCALGLAGCENSQQPVSGQEAVVVSISYWEPGVNREMETAFKEICAKYTQLHPEVTFDLRAQPASGYQDWVKARLAADEAPTIQMNHSEVLKDEYMQGYIRDISAEFNKPNPYADNQIWKDVFREGQLDAVHMYSYEPTYAIPFYGLGVAYYYNKDLYEELGLEIPETWDDFMHNCQVIQDAGTNPIAMMLMKSDALTWLNWYIMTGMYANYYLADENINPNRDVVVHDREITRAVKKGYFDCTTGFDNEAFNRYLDKVEQLSQYCEGATSLDEAGAKAQFLAGKAAHIMSGSWDLKAFSENQNFEVGTFALPKFTKEDSPYAGSNFKVSSAQVLGITNSEKASQEEIDAAIDFMKFFTSPDIYQIFIEATQQVPVVNGVAVDGSLDVFLSGENEPLSIFLKDGDSPNGIKSITIAVMSGKDYDRQELAEGLQASIDAFANSIIRKEHISAENDYDIGEIPVQGTFVPMEPE